MNVKRETTDCNLWNTTESPSHISLDPVNNASDNKIFIYQEVVEDIKDFSDYSRIAIKKEELEIKIEDDTEAKPYDNSDRELVQRNNDLLDQSSTSPMSLDKPELAVPDNACKGKNWLERNIFDQTGPDQNNFYFASNLNENYGSNQNEGSGSIIQGIPSCFLSLNQNSIIYDNNIIIPSNLTGNMDTNISDLNQMCVGAAMPSNLNSSNCLGMNNENALTINANNMDIDSMEVIYCDLKNANFEIEKVPSAASNTDSDYPPEEHNSDANQGSSENSDSASIKRKQKISTKSIRKFLRNIGETYTTSSGKVKNKRSLQPLQPCRNKCMEKLDQQTRETLFTEYWSLGSYDKRKAYVANLINMKEKTIQKVKEPGKKHKNRNLSYTYNFKYEKGNITVCKTCFLKTLDETPKFVQIVMNNKLKSVSGTIHSDLRGKHSPSNKLNEEKVTEIRDHILSFPAYESHYSRRHTSKKYLGSNLNLTIMYELYCESVTKPVSRPVYIREFHKLGLKFKKPVIDTCATCDRLAVTLRNLDDDLKAEEELKLRKHHEEADEKSLTVIRKYEYKAAQESSLVAHMRTHRKK